MRPFLIIILNLLFSLSAYSQQDSAYSPATLDEMFLHMNEELHPTQIKTLKELSEQDIREIIAYSGNLLQGYSGKKDSIIMEKLEERGMHWDEIYCLITVSYHRYLNGLDIRLEEQYRYYDSLRIEGEKECKESRNREKLEGKYIPKNIEECMIELDKILSRKNKKYIIKNGTDKLHMTLGMHLRNRWQLWGCSRLEKYFLDLNGYSFMHPDSMSGIILSEYEKWIKGDKRAWREWERQFSNKE